MTRVYFLLITALFSPSILHAEVPQEMEIPDPPELVQWTTLPEKDVELSEQLAAIVKATGLDRMTPAADNPDDEDEWSSICLVDFSDLDNIRVAGWKEDNFIYPASTYKMYVVGEAIRQITLGEYTLDKEVIVKEHNIRGGTRLKANEPFTVSEILRLTSQYSDNAAANEAIDLVDRRRASALMHALGCEGSEITRKYLSRDLEDEGYAEIRGTETNALHSATFLWAVESGAIGGGKGRGLIKSYLAKDERDDRRFRAGLPSSATVYSKGGTWNVFTSEAAIIEDGKIRFILCAFTAIKSDESEEMLAELGRGVYELLKE